MGKGAMLDATEKVRRATPPAPVPCCRRRRWSTAQPFESFLSILSRLRTKQKGALHFRDVLPVFFGFGSELFCNAPISDKV